MNKHVVCLNFRVSGKTKKYEVFFNFFLKFMQTLMSQKVLKQHKTHKLPKVYKKGWKKAQLCKVLEC